MELHLSAIQYAERIVSPGGRTSARAACKLGKHLLLLLGTPAPVRIALFCALLL
jgi:hypothetical protein